jgi:hypothetical protein
MLFHALFAAMMLEAALVQSQQLTIQIETGKQIILTRADIETLPRTKITTGDSTTFEGVTLRAVLEKACVGLGGIFEGIAD